MKERVFGFFDRLCLVLGALAFLQIPAFMQQYAQQLQGRIEELRLQVGQMREFAIKSGKTLEQLKEKFLASTDADIVHQGEFIQDMVTRLANLSYAAEALKNSSLANKFFVFLANMQYDILKSTLSHFSLGLTFSLEAILYALMGSLAAYSICYGIKKLIGLSANRVQV